jgi:CRISPR system Cascade subunit CasC
MLIEIHMLQNHAPSNLNRDDTGAPKDAMFGGYRRGRISSQCLKRAIRRSEAFRRRFSDDMLAERTRLLPRLIVEQLPADLDQAMRALIFSRAREIGSEAAHPGGGEDGDADAGAAAGKENETAQAIFISPEEVPQLAERLLDMAQQGAKEFQKAKIAEITRGIGVGVPRSVDIAMFGRMTTSTAFEDVAAAVQVAHAISTHRVDSEFDYFTAVDDISGESGAAMIGDVEFNSATYYKYLSVHWEGLLKNLGGDVAVARRAVGALIEAAALSNPSGKQNSFAAHNPPDLVLVETRDRNVPLSYANAFLRPVYARQDVSLMDASIQALADYMGRIDDMYALTGERWFASTTDHKLPASTHVPGLQGVLSAVEGRLS